MPVTLKQATLKYKNSNNQYQSADCIKGEQGPRGATGAGVPAVTSSDNGKFLRVVSGAWAAVTIPEANGVSFGTTGGE